MHAQNTAYSVGLAISAPHAPNQPTGARQLLPDGQTARSSRGGARHGRPDQPTPHQSIGAHAACSVKCFWVSRVAGPPTPSHLFEA
eukprot:365139-Chlamydomonas_euryale.AAC.11